MALSSAYTNYVAEQIPPEIKLQLRHAANQDQNQVNEQWSAFFEKTRPRRHDGVRINTGSSGRTLSPLPSR